MGISGFAAAARPRARTFVRRLAAVATLALLGTGTPALADAVRGAWSPVYAWPLIGIHAVLVPDGRVLTYGTTAAGQQTAYFIYDLWDPQFGPSNGHLTLSNITATDIFCGSQLVLPSTGAVLIAGGDNWTGTGTTNTGNNNSNVLDPATNTLARQADMNRARWYSTSTTLLNGETYIQGGSGGTDRPEIRSVAGAFRLLSGADTSTLDFMYPRNFIAPDGRVFGFDSNGRMYYVNTSGTGSIAFGAQLPAGNRGNDASAAMFRPGRILQFGGSSNGAVVIDINGASPTVTATASMSSQRKLATATVLADGKVLATGGSAVWNDMTGVNYTAEIWNPATGQWTVGAAGSRARLYHSTALLMPDASVLVAGGGAPGPQNNTNVEIYYPPYLFDANGARAVRPTIVTWPQDVAIGATLTLGVDSPAAPPARVTMVKTGSATHGWNMEQRFVELTFRQNANSLSVQAPTRAADAPPGFYILFVIDANGVPSIGKIVKVGVAANPNPQVVPVLQQPADQSTVVGTPVSLALTASDPNGDPIGFGASGLPPGLSIDPITGVISGTPTTGGSYDVVVAVSDGFNNATRQFVWTVNVVAPLQLPPPTPLAPSLIGAPVTFTAAATGGVGTQYSWDFDDGSIVTGWSSSGTIQHVFQQPGIYWVTVTAVDSRGQRQSQTFVHRAYLPPTTNRPTASTNLAFERIAGGAGRVWVVNQDNNSVSVIDAATRTRVAEVAVGVAPRSLAIAPGGAVWVTNKGSATISVIDPVTLAVSRTIPLPRASQPFGIAFAPTGTHAYVALEATGQVLKFDAASFARVATAEVGPNPRHLSVTADGTTLLVSRFVTPLQPNEAPPPNAPLVPPAPPPGGGEVLAVDANAMTPSSTIRLAYSTKEDLESQGSGVPNYLAAAVISPDGTQAWVPSKQDNVTRGLFRNGFNLDFDNTVRAISSRIVLNSRTEDLAKRVDHDNSSVASAAAYDPRGNYLFVALETSREVAVVDAFRGWEIFRFAVGRAPQGLALSDDGNTLYVGNFMDRTVQAFDLGPLLTSGTTDAPALATIAAIGTERLTAQVLRGKQLFYDAKDPRLAALSYMSCASCHNDGGHDGRVWDLTGFGEGLRNTISLRGRAAMGQGFLHWSANFDELQDFEGQIRALAGGTGLLADSDFASRSAPLGAAKAGLSPDLDALAAYVASLNAFDGSPFRAADGTLTAAATTGRTVFLQKNCAACHAGAAFTGSGAAALANIGTLKPSSGQRLGGTLGGLDAPTLRDVWATAPYLHDGSAATLADAVNAHAGVTVTAQEMTSLVEYLRQIGSEEASAPQAAGTGTGLVGRYYSNTTFGGTPALTRTEAIDFNWASRSPGGSVPRERFSVRWTGFVVAPATGTYRFQTESDEGIRVWIGGLSIVDDWGPHAVATATSGNVNLVAGQRYAIQVDYYENKGQAVARLRWRTPGNATFVAVPADRLSAN
jgi:YVTN family beta-propeller protein